MALPFPSRTKLTTFSERFDQIARRLSKPVPYPQRFDENEFNQEICQIFSSAADLLRRYNLDIEIFPSDLDYPASVLAHRKLVLEQMETELERRICQFQKAGLIAKQICNDQSDRLRQKYRTKIVELAHAHRALEAQLEETLRDARETFDFRLMSKVAPYAARKAELENDLGKLKTEALVTETTLKASIEAYEMMAQLLEKKRKLLEDSTAHVASTLTDKYAQQLAGIQSRFSAKTETLETENANLSRELAFAVQVYNAEKARLISEIENNEENKRRNMETEINRMKLGFEKRKRKIMNEHDRLMSGLQHELELETLSSTSHHQVLETDILQKTRALENAEVLYRETAAMIEKRKAIAELEKENEIALMLQTQEQALSQLASQHTLDVQREEYEMQKQRHELSQQLLELQRDSEMTKRKLENEITTLMRERDRLLEEVKEPRSEKPTAPRQMAIGRSEKFLVCDLVPQKLSEKHEVESVIQQRIELFSNAGRAEELTISKLTAAIDSQFELERNRMRLKLQEIERTSEFLTAEKAVLKTEISEIEKQLVDSEANEEAEAKKRMDRLSTIVGEQEGTMARLREELKRARSETTKTLTLDDVAADHGRTMAQLKAILRQKEADLQTKLHALESKYRIDLQREGDRTQVVLDELHVKISQAKDELNETQTALANAKQYVEAITEMREQAGNSASLIQAQLDFKVGEIPMSPSKLPPLIRKSSAP
jgi:hypothetical protein